MTVDFIEEDAVFGELVFDDGGSQADVFEIFLSQLVLRYFQKVGDKFDFLSGDPDVSLVGAGAASAALKALEMQAGVVPGCFFAFVHKDFR